MNPAICNEGEQAQPAQRVAETKEQVINAGCEIARQREIVEELARAGNPTTTAKRLLATSQRGTFTHR